MKKLNKTKILWLALYVVIIMTTVVAYKTLQTSQVNAELNSATTFIASTDDTERESITKHELTNKEALESYVNEEIGTIEIPRLDMEAAIVQGASNDDADMQQTMFQTIGHEPGSYLPGEGREIVLTGHREEQFGALQNIEEGDLIIVNILDNKYLYEVSETKIVLPDSPDALEYVRGPSEEEKLVLYTCYPFTPNTTVTHRFVVKADRIASKKV